MTNFCPNFTGYLVGTGNAANVQGKALLSRARCKSWSCDYCCEVNRAIWRAKIIRATQEGEWFMMTLTSHSKARTPQASLANLRNGWSKQELNWWSYNDHEWIVSKGLYGFMQDFSRDSEFQYVWVYEPHKDGAIHAHLLTNYHFVDYRQPRKVAQFHPRGKRVPLSGSRALKDAAFYLGMGFMTQTKHLGDNAGLAASYVTKYMTKNLRNLPKHTKRIITSHEFLVPDESLSSDYEWVLQPDLHVADWLILEGNGFSLYDVQLRRFIKPADFKLTHFYEPDC